MRRHSIRSPRENVGDPTSRCQDMPGRVLSLDCPSSFHSQKQCVQDNPLGTSKKDQDSNIERQSLMSLADFGETVEPLPLDTRKSESTRPTTRKSQTQKPVFVDANEMKSRIRAAATKKPYSVHDLYKDKGLFQRVARHYRFENFTLMVISVNALWIGLETDLNTSSVFINSHPAFQFAEHAFCIYFTAELFIRFMSFRYTQSCCRDAWFVFDSCLVLSMILETWVMTSLLVIAGSSGSSGMFSNASMLRIARLLRLSRMARMARLFRAMPELLILIKAMAASLRSCFFVFILLCAFLYVFGICFRQLAEGTQLGEEFFPTVPASMHSLWLYGTLLDNVEDIVAALLKEGVFYCALFYIFLLLSALTVMNMLIGVLCEVVSGVAAIEKETMAVSFVKSKLHQIIEVTGLDSSGKFEITKAQLTAMLQLPEACKCLQDVGVDVFMLVDSIDFIFATDDDDDAEDTFNEGKVLSFEEFMCVVLDLRGTNNCTVKDVVGLHRHIKESIRALREDLRHDFELRLQPSNGRRHALRTVEGDSEVSSSRLESNHSMGTKFCHSNGLTKVNSKRPSTRQSPAPGRKDGSKILALHDSEALPFQSKESFQPKDPHGHIRHLDEAGTLTSGYRASQSSTQMGVDCTLESPIPGASTRGLVECSDAMVVLKEAIHQISLSVEKECLEKLQVLSHKSETSLKNTHDEQYVTPPMRKTSICKPPTAPAVPYSSGNTLHPPQPVGKPVQFLIALEPGWMPTLLSEV